MQEDFADEGALEVNILDFIGSNILSLLQLEDILLSVDDLKAKRAWHNLPNIASSQPSVGSDSFFIDLRSFVVSEENLRTSNEKLTSWRWSSLTVFVLRSVFHLGNVTQLDFRSNLNNIKDTLISERTP